MTDTIAQRNYLALKQKSYAIKFDLEGTDYRPIENIGTGAYGVVCSAVNVKTEKKVAIKKIPSIFEQRTIAKRTYREIKILKHFKHDNIISIQEILHPRVSLDQFKDIYIVLDLMESDLHRIIHSHQDLTEEHVRFFTYQILRGLKYVHSANVVHRDLKPSNLLVNENCALKIGDFGMARGISNNMDEYSLVMTQYVATRWYRAPELMILPKETYTEAVDMWSVGCILAEMIGRKQLFPGQSHVDQIERIVDKLGTPTNDYLKMTSSPLITGLIMKKGHVKAVKWKDVYPKASVTSLDLLSRMLMMDPKRRITVNEALAHPFLNKYHDPEDEPICLPLFNFDFERENPTTQQLKDAIIEEVMEFHKPKAKPRKMQFNFRSVPKSELVQSPTSNKFNFKPVPKSELDIKEKEVSTNESITKDKVLPPTGIEAFLQYKEHKGISLAQKPTARQSSEDSSDGARSDGSFERKHSQLVEDLQKIQALQENIFSTGQKAADFLQRPGHPTEFKKPQGFPLVVKVAEPNNKASCGVTIKSSSNDVEMPSANSSIRQQPLHEVNVAKPGDSADVEMPSAKGESSKITLGEQKTDNQQQPGAPSEDTKPVDMKELIRKALLNNERKKQKEAVASKPKPITALQRQREREEKRKQKQEKAKLKQKKAKNKSPSVQLTDEDKKLLEKWQTMQKTAKQDNVEHSSSPDKPATDNTVTPRSVNNPVTQQVTEGNLNVSGAIVGVQMSSLNSSATPGIGQTLHGIKSHPDNMGGTQMPPMSTVLPSFTTGTSDELAQSGVSCSTTVNSVSAAAPQTTRSLPFNSYNWDNPSVPQVVNEMSPPFSVDTSASSKLPSYMEALQSKALTEDVALPQTGPVSTAVLSQDNAQSRHISCAPTQQLEANSWAGLPAVPVDAMPGARSKEDHDMKIITKQLQQQLVEDLILVNTPKGTGGGYGVASDFDIFMDVMNSEGKLDKPDSAQLSPSLFEDWRELTGNLDQGEFDRVLEHMSSPISSQDLNTVMLTLMSPKTSSKVS